MRPGAVRAGGNDRVERLLLGSELVEELEHPPGELTLGAADEPLLGDPLVRPVRDRGRPADLLELVLPFDRAQAFDQAHPRDELEAAVAELLVVSVGEIGALEGELARQELGHVGDRLSPGLDELDVRDGARGPGVTEIGEQPDSLRLDDDRDVRADEAGQVADVRRGGDDQRLFELLYEFFGAGVHSFPARYARASR